MFYHRFLPPSSPSSIAASFNQPYGLAFDPSSLGNLYVTTAAGAPTVRLVDPYGVTSTLAGGVSSGLVDLPGTSAAFASLQAAVFDVGGANLIVTDTSELWSCTSSPARVPSFSLPRGFCTSPRALYSHSLLFARQTTTACALSMWTAVPSPPSSAEAAARRGPLSMVAGRSRVLTCLTRSRSTLQA